MKIFICFVLLIISLSYANAQETAVELNNTKVTMGLKFFGLSIHPMGALNTQYMPMKFDKKGIFVLNTGITTNIEYFVYKDFISIKFVQALYADCVRKFGGFTHLGFRGKILEIGKHSLNGGMGPTFIYRKSWYALDDYDDRFSFFYGNPGDTWQYRFLWYGGEFEYNYVLNETFSLSTSFIPGFPDLLNLSIGFRIKL